MAAESKERPAEQHPHCGAICTINASIKFNFGTQIVQRYGDGAATTHNIGAYRARKYGGRISVCLDSLFAVRVVSMLKVSFLLLSFTT